jgi:hypothetical protein
VNDNLEDTPEKSEVVNEDPAFTITKLEDLFLLSPVKIHVKTPIKKRKHGELLRRLHLDDILFQDEDDPSSKKGKPKTDNEENSDDYQMLSEEAKRQKVSTQSTATIEAFYHKYHATPAADNTIITIDKTFKRDLAKFVADSYEKWNWSSEANHQKTIADWAKKMKAKDCSDSKKEWIRDLIKAMKEERAQFTKVMTNEFMFTRATMVKGIRTTAFMPGWCTTHLTNPIQQKWLFQRKSLRLKKNGFEANLRNWISSTLSICIKQIGGRMFHAMWK